MVDLMMDARDVYQWIIKLRGGWKKADEKTEEIIDRVFEQVHKVAPCGDNDRHELWLRASVELSNNTTDRLIGLDDEEYILDDGEGWFLLATVEQEDYRSVFLGREQIYQSEIYGDGFYDYETVDSSALFLWIEAEVKKCIQKLKDGTYNHDVAENLPYIHRTGTILRKDYWDLFPGYRIEYLKNINKEEIDTFLNNIADQKDNKPVGQYIKEMTSGMFFQYCSAGYEANGYAKIKGLSPKDQYKCMADGRDTGLCNVDQDSPDAFKEWYQKAKVMGGHPWEVCRGGTFSHIDLYVMEDERGWCLLLCGDELTRSVETVKFYNALRSLNVAVVLDAADGIAARFTETDKIGITPKHMNTILREIPVSGIIDFISLNEDPIDRKKVIEKAEWLPEKEQRLL